MDRIEYSKLISKVRAELNVSKYRAAKDSGLTEIQIGQIDNAKHSYSVENMLKYLNAINVSVKVSSICEPNTSKILYSYKDIVDWIVKCRQNKFTQRELAEKIGCSYVTVANIEKQKTIVGIDIFLRIVEVLEYKIGIIKI